ncbi:hypothetical protein J1605_021232 [Eschrichtius robustus]|uniref:Uncharacterized protein n=1 Tax=Eschrichtius robustus TaxID=9764 RepID=A0AB34HJS6_ESCRO|nr:hypothetical protein J1605_021232 [Eschrichtius robustus]
MERQASVPSRRSSLISNETAFIDSLTAGCVTQGVEVQTDYVPLLNSLAAYGWQLTCVLPTPVVKTTRFLWAQGGAVEGKEPRICDPELEPKSRVGQLLSTLVKST